MSEPERPTPKMEADEGLIGRTIIGGGAPEESFPVRVSCFVVRYLRCTFTRRL